LAAGDPGMLFVDAPLPVPPRRMPALLASGAVLAVAVLVALIVVSRPTPPKAGLALKLPLPDPAPIEVAPTPGTGALTGTPSLLRPTEAVAATVEELVALLKKGDPALRVTLTGTTY